VARATELATRLGARLDIVGFIYEHLANQPVALDEKLQSEVQRKLAETHELGIKAAIPVANSGVVSRIDVFWEKRVAESVIQLVSKRGYDLVIKGGNRSETFLYTSTDWKLLRSCTAPVLLLANKRWRRSQHVMAAVDLGTRVRSKRALNFKLTEIASELATASGSELHIAYAVPYSGVLRDLGILDKAQLRREGMRLMREFRGLLEARGIKPDGVHVAVGAPEKSLVDLAARSGTSTVVLGCVGRKKLVGKVIGNTAEQILRLLKADVLAIKP